MARIYSVNQHHSCDYGVDFINGVAAVPDTDVNTVAWFTDRGYTVVTGSNVLSPWDYLTLEELRIFAPYISYDTTGKTKKEIVAAIEAALITLMKIEIIEFDDIPNIAGGKVGAATYADAAAVKAALPVTVTAAFENGTVATVPVTAWVDTDTYNAGVAASYTFTATLGDLPLPFANTVVATATVEVIVAAA